MFCGSLSRWGLHAPVRANPLTPAFAKASSPTSLGIPCEIRIWSGKCISYHIFGRVCQFLPQIVCAQHLPTFFVEGSNGVALVHQLLLNTLKHVKTIVISPFPSKYLWCPHPEHKTSAQDFFLVSAPSSEFHKKHGDSNFGSTQCRPSSSPSVSGTCQ